MLGGADNPNGELPSYITGADNNACSSASSTNVVSMDDETRHPTMYPANTSMMNAT